MADLSGDGIDDLVYANMWYGAERGAVYGWFGPIAPGTHTASDADFWFVGEIDGAWTGRGLTAGDFDGDGTSTLVVAASAYRLWVPGLVYVFDEPIGAGELTLDDTVVVYRGEEPAASTGRSMATCDTDRDGRDELVVGAHQVDFSKEVPDAGVFYWLESVE